MRAFLTGRRVSLYRSSLRPLFLLFIVCALPPPAGAGMQPLSLERAVELGLRSDETLRQAALGVTGAEAQVMQAKSNAFPQVSLAGQYGRNFLKPSFFLPAAFFGEGSGSVRVEIGEDNDFAGSASVSQVLWAAGRVSAGLEAAKEYLASFRFRELATADYVRFSVKEAYYGALLAAEILGIEEKASAAAGEAARIARLGYEQGVVSKFDRMRADVELANRKAPLVKARNDFDQAIIVLKRRCGLGAADEISLSDSLTAAAHPAGLDSVIAAMRAGSAEIKALEHAVGAQRQFLRIAKADRYPMLRLTGSYAVQTQWSNDWLPPSDLIAKSAAVQIGLQIPIFDGLNAKGKIGKAKAEVRTAEIELERVGRDKELAVRQSYLFIENALIALEGREESTKLAEEAHRIALVRLANGLATPLERLDAELAMTAARAQLAEALFSSRMAQAYLELAVGNRNFGAVAGKSE
ncbi:MAG: TolC family protein [Candidatus Krumholzibacteriia bacterium]